MNPYLAEALDLARKGRGRVSPNPAVGAVIVREGVVVGRGFHLWAGVQHAETLAIAEAGAQAKGATMYVSLEPCSHKGRTGPCADAVIAAGISKVVIPTLDPNPLVAGSGVAKLVGAGIPVEIDSEGAAAAIEINEAFFHFMNTGRPLVTLKAAVTLDGKIAAPDNNDGWITSETAREHVQTLRHESDSILTGIGTVLTDDCLLTDRTSQERSRPLLRVVADSQLRLPSESKMVTSCKNDVLVATTTAGSPERRKRLENAGVRVEVLEGHDGRVDLRAVVALLARERYLSLMVEGGSRLNWTVLEHGIADKIYFYYAPKILGGMQALPVAGGTGRRGRKDAIQFHGVRVHPIPPDEFAVEAYLNPRT
jgi:diaminohydroxyphosphoribosylaminopyrimidine deaminase/5-amino-6-(5-phosphoribosylamino)uracil reductase